MQRINAQRAAQRNAGWPTVERWVTLGAAIAAILGVFFWISEGPDRDEERSNRRAELLGRAEDAIARAAEDGVISTTYDHRLEWAVETLASLNSPISLRAPIVDLGQLRLDCGYITISADTFDASRAVLRGVEMEIYSPSIDMRSLRAIDTKILVLPSINSPHPKVNLDLSGSVMEKVRISGLPLTSMQYDVELKAWDITARELELEMSARTLTYEWLTGTEGGELIDAGCMTAAALAGQDSTTACATVGERPAIGALQQLHRADAMQPITSAYCTPNWRKRSAD